MYPIHHAYDYQPPHEARPGALSWETKRALRRSRPQALAFERIAHAMPEPWPQVPPPEPKAGAGGHAGWLTRLFRRPVRALAH